MENLDLVNGNICRYIDVLFSYDGKIYYGDLECQNHADTWRNYISYVPQSHF